MIEELKRMFSFLYLIEGERKKEYKKRTQQRGTEILNGINCSLEETVNLRALYACRARFIRLGQKIIPINAEVSEHEINCRLGYAKDFEKFVFAMFFDHLDEEEFILERSTFYDEVRNDFRTEQNKRYEDLDPFGYEYEKELKNAINDEKLEKEYGVPIKKQKIIKPVPRKGKSIRTAKK